MEEGKLTTAVLGLAGEGTLLAKAAAQTGFFQIKAVADKDTQLLQKVSAEYCCASYDDYRRLIMQHQLDCLLVAADIHICEEHIRAAIKKKFNILKLAPPARDFEEASELVRLAESEKVTFAVANTARFTPSFSAAHEILLKNQIEQIYLIEAFYSADDCDRPAWQIDPRLSGGGVLLHDCYNIIDQILWNFPIPGQIYALSTNQAPDRKQRLSLTEDTTIVSMRFTDTLVGNLTAFRRANAGPKNEFIRVHGKDKVLTVTGKNIVIIDRIEHTSRETKYDDNPYNALVGLLNSFALSLIAPDENRYCGTGRDNLKNMAVIKSAYLSACTGFPEEPARILRMGVNQLRLSEIANESNNY
jgi:predicted dehydrogenase